MRALKWGLGVLAILVVAVVVAVLTIDVNRFKPQIVAAVEEATGRKLDIAQDMKLSLWPLGVSVKQVSFANAAWGSRPQMATIGEFTAQVDLFALLGQQIKIDRLVLADVDVLLEKNRQGQANWEFQVAKPAEQVAPSAQEKAEAKDASFSGLPVVSDVSLKNVKLAYRDAQSGAKNDVNLSELSVKQAAGGLLATKLAAVVDGNEIRAEGTLGSLDELMAPSRPWPVKLTVTVPGAKASLDGSIAQPLQAKGLALKLGADIPDLSALAGKFGATAPAVPVSLQADVKDVAPQRYNLSGIAVKLGDSDLSGSGEVNLAGAKPAVKFDLASKSFDVTRLMLKDSGGKSAPAGSSPGGGSGTSAPAAKSDGRLFSNDPLPLDGLNAVDAVLAYKAEQFKAPTLDVQGLALDLVLKDGVLQLKPAIQQLAGGSLGGDVTLNSKSKALTAKLNGKGIVLSDYLQKSGITDVVRRGGATDLALDVTSQGASLRQIMAGLNGRVVIKVGEGELKEEYVRATLPRLADAVGALSRATAKTKLHCVVTGLDIKAGIATPKALLAETGSLTITGDGTVNLGTEQLDLRIIPSSRDTSLAAALPPVRVRGMLLDPSFSPDPAALAKSVIGTAAGIAALGPLALLSPALGSGGDNAETACAKAVALAEGRPVPQSSQQPAQQQQQAPASPLQDLRKGLGGLLGR
ncbi:AsmA family protein [Ferrovibrio sp.]|uniref:AsmA family protein n=1 Tax=Ferrovibrio sp. TaxID=1917215 RepID=UPI0026252360|nr:AsmA family protein [Ferrovibrio sp.]